MRQIFDLNKTIMSHLTLQEISKKFMNKKMPMLRPGYQVRVHQKIKEGEKERIQVFEGLVVGISHGHGASKTFTVRKVVEGIGVEKIFPIHSPLIAKLEIKKTLKIRRAKLNFMRAGSVSKRLGAHLGLLEKDEIHKKKKGLHEEEPEAPEESAPVEEVAEAEAAPKKEAPAAEEKAAKEEPAKEETPQEEAPEGKKKKEE